MIAVTDRVPDLKRLRSEPAVGKSKTINESEMALFHECTRQCGQKELDTADLVGDAILQQQAVEIRFNRIALLTGQYLYGTPSSHR